MFKAIHTVLQLFYLSHDLYLFLVHLHRLLKTRRCTLLGCVYIIDLA